MREAPAGHTGVLKVEIHSLETQESQETQTEIVLQGALFVVLRR
jgi:hypothetical protein